MKEFWRAIKNRKGVSLITLIISMIIMLIIIGAIVFGLIHNENVQKIDRWYTGFTILNEKIDLYYIKYGKLPVKQQYLSPLNLPEDVINPNDSDEYYVVDVEALGEIANIEDKTYVINAASHTVYAIEGIDIEDSTVYRLPETYTEIKDTIKMSYTIKEAGNNIVIYVNAEETIDGIKSIKFGDNETKVFDPNTKNISEIYTVPTPETVHVEIISNSGEKKEFDVEIIGYTVAFNANGGTGTMASMRFIRGVGKKILYNTFTRRGYTFKNWNTVANGSGTSYFDAQYLDMENVTGTVNLYAQWTPNVYSITYNLNGGVNNNENPNTFVFDTPVTLKDPSRIGYTFTGWYDAQTGGNKITVIDDIANDVVLYARWTPNPDTKYTVKHYTHNYGANTYTLNETQELKGTTDSSLTLTNLKKTIAGYTYVDGYLSGDTTKQQVEQ